VPQRYCFTLSDGSFQKRATLAPLGTEEISTIRRGGEKKLFVIIVSVLGQSNFEGDRGLTSNFLYGGGINVLWNDPMSDDFTC
jgi:hypothetical protein